jgi:V/A-type H+-transporting ATPase subunit C
MTQRAEDVNAPAGLLRYLQREIDATNLRTALKVRGTGAVAADLFVPGGHDIRQAAFEALVNDPDAGALSALAGSAFSAAASAAAAGDLGTAEGEIRKVLDADARRLALDPLDIGVVVDFLRRKEAEAAQLRLLARGKFYGVPREALDRELAHA